LKTWNRRSLVNESRLEEVNERLDLIFSLQKKHRVNSDTELITVRDQFSAKISGILFADEDIEKLKTESDKLHQEMADLAQNQ
jgi:DNA repair protein RecN (Recombination protein N)